MWYHVQYIWKPSRKLTRASACALLAVAQYDSGPHLNRLLVIYDYTFVVRDTELCYKHRHTGAVLENVSKVRLLRSTYSPFFGNDARGLTLRAFLRVLLEHIIEEIMSRVYRRSRHALYGGCLVCRPAYQV